MPLSKAGYVAVLDPLQTQFLRSSGCGYVRLVPYYREF
jgi:hypothetical protein